MPTLHELPSIPTLTQAAFEWKFVDQFSVHQMGYLWSGYEPITEKNMCSENTPPNYHAVVQMLTGLLENGKLPRVGNEKWAPKGYARVNRADLIKAFQESGPFPSFLFDTLPPPGSLQKEDVQMDESKFVGLSFEDKQGGSPSQYNWNKIAASVVMIEVEEGLVDSAGAPMSFIAICRRVHSYIKNNYSFDENGSYPVPDLSTIQRRLDGFLKQFLDLRKKHENKKSKQKH